MSTQSGITASSELQEKFKHVQSSGARGLIVQIDNETCVPVQTITGSDNLLDDFETVHGHLTEKEARYILLRSDETSSGSRDESFLFISFVPDSAHVRSKMLYASSAHTVQRQLGGSEIFSSVIFWSSLAEVSARGWQDHQKHEAALAPLSEEESALSNVREKETVEMMGTVGRKSHYVTKSSQIEMKSDEAVVSQLSALAKAQVPTVLGLAIDLSSETVTVAHPITACADVQQLVSTIATETPQYTIWAGPERVTFVYTCPMKSKVKARMVYATNRGAVIRQVESLVAPRQVQVFEASDREDVSSLVAESQAPASAQHPPVSNRSNLSFARPKRPGRK